MADVLPKIQGSKPSTKGSSAQWSCTGKMSIQMSAWASRLHAYGENYGVIETETLLLKTGVG